MEVNIIDIMNKNEILRKEKFATNIFESKFNEALIHQVITSYLSNGRSAIKAEKNRSDVRGGGIKPFRQKGTGKARAGSIRSPIWRGGGKTFTASYRNYTKKINKKMYKQAMRCIFSELIRQKRLIVIEKLNLDTPKTKDIVIKMNALDICSGILIVNNIDKNVHLSIKNIPNFFIQTTSNINPVILIKNKNIIVTLEALKKLEGLLK
jgi:large subunit ribosomal protein L4